MPVLVPPVQTALWAAAQQVVAHALGDRRRPGRLETVAGIACVAAGGATAAGLMTTLTPQIRREEAALARFGDDWAAYTQRVRRWL